jgi:diadenosine tetraphosphate (Ap4A) HIT family hydrolase
MKKKLIVDIHGHAKKIACLSCATQNGEVEPPGGSIFTSKYFDAHQDYEIPIPGFVIITSKRHLKSVDEFTDAEQRDFIKTLCRLRLAMRKALGIKIVYLFEREDATISHFHIWLFPRYSWMEKKFGLRISSVKPILEYARENLKTPSNIKKVETAIKKLKQFLGTK